MDKATAIERIKEHAPEGTTILCVLEHMSDSRMTRWIKFYVMPDGASTRGEYPVSLDYWIRELLDIPMHPKHDGVKVGGCGMDMGYHALDLVSQKVYGFDRANVFQHRWL